MKYVSYNNYLVFAYQFSKQYSPGFLVLLNIAEKQVFDYHVTLARDSPISVFVCFDSLSLILISNFEIIFLMKKLYFKNTLNRLSLPQRHLVEPDFLAYMNLLHFFNQLKTIFSD